MQVHWAADTRPFWAMAGSLQVDAFDARAGVVSMAVAMMAAVRFTVSLPLVVFCFLDCSVWGFQKRETFGLGHKKTGLVRPVFVSVIWFGLPCAVVDSDSVLSFGEEEPA